MQEGKYMLAHTKAALIALALVLSCSTAFAQDDPPGPPPESRGMDGGMGPRDGMRGGPMRDGGQWGDGQRDGGHGRDEWGHSRGRFGMGGQMGMGRREFGLSRLLRDPNVREKLGVTAEQAATIRRQESEFRKSEIRIRAEAEVKRIDLQELLAADKPDRAAIDNKLQEISAARLTQEKSAVDYRLTMRDALTPAQRDKLRQLMSERRGHRDGDGQRGTQRGWRDGQRGQQASPPNPSSPPPASH